MSRPGQPLVSVVTPVYNGAEYLEECLESVARQTYPHWEHVVLDNCSTDATGEIVRRFEERDSRFRLVEAQDFVDAVENANRALREMSPDSTYCKVLHADDWLFPECLERMVALAEEHPSVGIVGAYRLEETRVTLTGLPHSISVIPGREFGRSSLLGGPYPWLFGSPSSLLLRSNLVRGRDPFYNVDNPFQDDQEACYEVLRESDFGFVHQVLTFTRRDEWSPFSYFVRLGAEIPGQIDLLLRFTPVYLTHAEFQRRLGVLLMRYARFLLQRLPSWRDVEFRQYHLGVLVRLNRTLSSDDVRAGVSFQLRRLCRGRVR